MSAVAIVPAAAQPRESLLLHLSTITGLGGQLVLPCPGDLTFSIAVPGGHDQMSCTLAVLGGSGGTPPQIVIGAIVQVIDRETGTILWWGRLDDPGQAVTVGELTSYQITASGGQSLLDGWRRAYSLVDRNLEHWIPDGSYPPGSTVIGDVDSAGASGVFTAHPNDWITSPPDAFLEGSIPDGASVPINSTQQWRYYPPWQNPDAPSWTLPGARSDAGIAAVFFSHKESATTSSWSMQLYIGASSWAGMSQATTQTWSTTQTDVAAFMGSGGWSGATRAKTVLLRWIFTGASKTQAGNIWARFGNIIVCGTRYDRLGNAWVFSNPPDLTSAIVLGDAIGRGLSDILEWDATLAAPAEEIDQAEWWGGVSGREILDFILSFSPYCWWGVFEPGDSGKPRASFKNWLTQPVRYIIPAGTVLSLAGGAESLANQALVIYQAGNGVTASVRVSVSVPVLTAAGITTAITVDVRDRGPISAVTAQTLGTAALTQTDVYRVSGTVTISEPIFDLVAGRMVQPWELVPGNPVRLSGVAQVYTRKDDRTTNTIDTFRATAVSYDAGSNAATLTLDGGSRGLTTKIKKVAALLPTPRPSLGRSIPR